MNNYNLYIVQYIPDALKISFTVQSSRCNYLNINLAYPIRSPDKLLVIKDAFPCHKYQYYGYERETGCD